MRVLCLTCLLLVACAIGHAGPDGVHGWAFGHGVLEYCEPQAELPNEAGPSTPACTRIAGGLPTSSADIKAIAIEALTGIAALGAIILPAVL